MARVQVGSKPFFEGGVYERRAKGKEEEEKEEEEEDGEQQQQQQLSLVELVLAALRKSMVGCRAYRRGQVITAVQRHMEIGCPTDVRHITHVTFDRFNGFLGLPIEFEVEIPPGRVPSASASVFGVSPESMQCCYDTKGNSVPTILLLMQERLYSQGGLKAEGIFRINPENGKEEIVRDQLNRGIVPDDIDVHCLAGLIKAWFRELPEGILDGLSPESVLDCNTEKERIQLVKQLLPMQSALLNWAVELMADVVEEEEINKMNARNIAMVFAPNMTQMSDPLTALVHAVQVMNLLKALILRCLREREEAAAAEEAWSFSSSPLSEEEEEEEEEDLEEVEENPDDDNDNDDEVGKNGDRVQAIKDEKVRIEMGSNGEGSEDTRYVAEDLQTKNGCDGEEEIGMITTLPNNPSKQFQRSIEMGVIKC